MNIDPRFNGQIFRKSFAMILAQNRQLASILPVTLAYNSGGYSAGQVLARNTTSGQYQNYVNGGPSGTGTAASILFEDVDVSEFVATSGTVFARGIFGGEVYTGKLIGLDANAISNLNARTIIDSTGASVTKF